MFVGLCVHWYIGGFGTHSCITCVCKPFVCQCLCISNGTRMHGCRRSILYVYKGVQYVFVTVSAVSVSVCIHMMKVCASVLVKEKRD